MSCESCKCDPTKVASGTHFFSLFLIAFVDLGAKLDSCIEVQT